MTGEGGRSRPVVVGLDHQSDSGHVEHHLPGDEAFPGELDDAFVGHVGEEVAVELAVALEDLDKELAVVEEVEDPVDGVESVDDPGEVVDDVIEVVVVLERLEGLVEVEEEEKEHDKQIKEAENGSPIAPARPKRYTKLKNLAWSQTDFLQFTFCRKH